MPSDMLHELRERLDKRPFRYCASLSGIGVYDILVRVDPDASSPWAMQLLPDPTDSPFPGARGNCKGDVRNDSQAWHLQCCGDALLHDVQVWLKALRETDDNVVFGDKKLPQELFKGTRVINGPDDEI